MKVLRTRFKNPSQSIVRAYKNPDIDLRIENGRYVVRVSPKKYKAHKGFNFYFFTKIENKVSYNNYTTIYNDFYVKLIVLKEEGVKEYLLVYKVQKGVKT